MDKKTTSNLFTINFFEAMFLLFLGLKIANVIDWSWWWVFAPLWMPIAIIVGGVGLIGLFLIIAKLLERNKNAKKTNKK